ncbi:MAG: TRAP transporter substrate-binding protein [bacterium]|nr:TRAP transporter substrate-binding protein [bacterium]
MIRLGLASLIGFGSLMTALGLGGCSPTAQDGPESWVLSNVHIETYPTARGLVRFAELVAADPTLARRVELDLQLGGVLGNEKETLEKLRFGALQMVCASAAPLQEFAPVAGVLALPFLFRDSGHLWTVLEGEIGDEISAGLIEAGFVPLAWYDAGARSFYNRTRPIHRPKDLVGLKIRVQRSEMMRDLVESLGASPVALGFKQVYTSLHTGAIDGAENNLPSYRSERHFEAAGFYSADRHAIIPDVVLVSRERWQELSVDEQKALRAAAEASALAQRRFWADYRKQAAQAVTEAGSVINEVDDPEAFRQAVEPVYDKHAGRYGDLVERIRSKR